MTLHNYLFLYRSGMRERAWEMMQHLHELGVGEQPIVWVGHSKGGLFVKQMLVHGKFLFKGCNSKAELSKLLGN